MDILTLLAAALFFIFAIVVGIGAIIAIILVLLSLFPALLPILGPIAAVYYKIFGKKEEQKRSDYSIEMGEEPHKRERR